MSIDTIISPLIDGDFLLKVDNLMGKGSKYVADNTPISPTDENFARIEPPSPSKLERLSRWAHRKMRSLAEAHTAQKVGDFIQNPVFKINWSYFSPNEQLDRIYRLEKSILNLQVNTEKKLKALEGKRIAVEQMNPFKRFFYSKPSSKEIAAYRGASETLSKALKTLRELGESARLQKTIETPVMVVPLSAQERDIHILFQADPSFKRHMDFADYLGTKKISTTPFLAMVRQLEAQPYGKDLIAPLREQLYNLSDIGASDEDFLGILDQEEIKKFNFACMSYLENRFGRHLVHTVVDQKEMASFLAGTFTITEGLTYSVITGLIFHRLVMSLEKMKKKIQAEAAEKRAAPLVKQQEEVEVASIETASMTSDSTEEEREDTPPAVSCPDSGMKKLATSLSQIECPNLGIRSMAEKAKQWKCPNLGMKKIYDSLREERVGTKFKAILDIEGDE